MLLKLVAVLINSCEQKNPKTHTACKSSLSQAREEKVAHLLYSGVKNHFSRQRDVKLKFREFIYARVSVIVCTEGENFHTYIYIYIATQGEAEL